MGDGDGRTLRVSLRNGDFVTLRCADRATARSYVDELSGYVVRREGRSVVLMGGDGVATGWRRSAPRT
jgi:hypothetical protein